MPDLFGPLPRHAVADLPLIAAVLAPLAAAAINAVAGDHLERRPHLHALATRAGAATTAGLVSAVGCGLAGLVVAVGLASALGAPSGLAVSPAWILARIGSVDAVLGLDVDVARGLVALAACALGGVASLRAGRAAPGRPVGAGGDAAATRSAILVAGAVAAVLADGVATGVLGLGLVLAASASWAHARWALGAGAIALLVLGGAVMAWSLEGQWLQGLRGGYLSSYQPRFVAVRDAPAPNTRPRGAGATEGRGSLTMTSTPGAEVHTGVADESTLRSRRQPLGTAPFVGAPVPAVLHKVAVVPGAGAVVGGDGLEVALLDVVDVRSGDDVVLQPVGATITWRDLDAQLALRDQEARHPLRSELAGRTLGGAAAPTAVLALLFAAALAALLDLPRRVAAAVTGGGRLDGALVGGALALAAVMPAARAGALVPLATSTTLLVMAGALIVAGVAFGRRSGPWLGGAAALVAAAAALIAVTADAGRLAAPIAALGAVGALVLSHRQAVARAGVAPGEPVVATTRPVAVAEPAADAEPGASEEPDAPEDRAAERAPAETPAAAGKPAATGKGAARRKNARKEKRS